MGTTTFWIVFAFMVLGTVIFMAAQIAGGFRELGWLLKSGFSDFRDDPVGALKSVGRYYKNGAVEFFKFFRMRAELFCLRRRYGLGRVYGFRSDDPRLIEYWVGGQALCSSKPGRLNGGGKSAKILSYGFDSHGLAIVRLQNATGNVFTRSAADLRPAN